MKKPSPPNSFEKALVLNSTQFEKCRSHSTHMKKPSPPNSFEKALVLNSTQFEKADPIQLIRNSQSLTQPSQ
jgi:hypothetical protein